MQITSYNFHLALLRSELCRANTAQSTRAVARPASLRYQSGLSAYPWLSNHSQQVRCSAQKFCFHSEPVRPSATDRSIRGVLPVPRRTLQYAKEISMRKGANA